MFYSRFRKKNPKSILISVILLVAFFALLSSQVNASQSKTFVVGPDQVVQVPFYLNQGEDFSGSVSVSGGSGSYADFIYCHVDRQGYNSMDIFSGGSLSGSANFNLKAPGTDTFTMVFVNRDTQTSRTVTIFYDISAIPEFPSWVILLILMLTTLLSIAFIKRRIAKNTR